MFDRIIILDFLKNFVDFILWKSYGWLKENYLYFCVSITNLSCCCSHFLWTLSVFKVFNTSKTNLILQNYFEVVLNYPAKRPSAIAQCDLDSNTPTKNSIEFLSNSIKWQLQSIFVKSTDCSVIYYSKDKYHGFFLCLAGY